MKIALMTEGTYPFAFGGVSVWCDQLIRGMPGYEFHVVALVATATEPTVWALPGNVVSLVKMPLWGPAPVTPAGRRGGGRRAGLPLQLLRQLIDILLDPYAGARQRFGVVLRELHEYCSRPAGSAGSPWASPPPTWWPPARRMCNRGHKSVHVPGWLQELGPRTPARLRHPGREFCGSLRVTAFSWPGN